MSADHCCSCAIAAQRNRRRFVAFAVVALIAGAISLVALNVDEMLASVGWGLMAVQHAGAMAVKSWRLYCLEHGDPEADRDPPLPPRAA